MNLDSDSIIALVMHVCKQAHDKVSCTRLQNYTIVYTKMAKKQQNLLLQIIKQLDQSAKQRDILAT